MDLASGELRKQGVKVRLQEQPFQVLRALVEHPGELITREDLQKRLWPGDTATDFERGLNKAINRLRGALGDSAANPRYVETLPQRGYRFIGAVEGLALEAPSAPPRSRTVTPRRRVLLLAGALASAPVAGVVAYRSFFIRPIRSIAVLPLENLSRDPSQEYFSDGMTDELIGEIARIRSLHVISRTSVMRYKGEARESLREIARELGADAIVEGAVTLSGSNVRITAQLIRSQDDRHLWSERYDRNLADVLSLQSEVAGRIAREIQIRLTPEEQTSLARKRPVDASAYEAFLQGNFFLQKSIPGIAKSVELFEESIRLDPTFADSHSGLAQALCDAGIYGIRPPNQALPAARSAARKALQLDPTNAAAHNVLADVEKGYDWDLAGAETEYRQALQLNPSRLLSHLRYGDCLSRMRRHEEAFAEIERARRLDPVSAMTRGIHAMVLFRARRYEDSIRAAREALEFDPSFVNALWWEGMSYAGKQEYGRSIACLTTAVGMSDTPLFRALLGHVHALAGERAEALRLLEEQTAIQTRRYVSPMDFAILHAGLGDVDAAFAQLEDARAARTPRMHELTFMYFDRLRGDARYADLVRRVGLPAQT